MRFALLPLALSLSLVACQTEDAEKATSNDNVPNAEIPMAAKVSLDISGMT